MNGAAIRTAHAGDADAIAQILNHEIAHGTAHFGTSPIEVDEVRTWIGLENPRHTVLVATDRSGVLGFCKSGVYKPRGGYAWTVEISAYIAAGAQGRGVGSVLYAELFDRIEAAGVRTVLAGITLPNDASVRLHERCGMRRFCVQERVGFKGGSWHDVGYWIRHFGGDEAPADATPLA
ncbi:MAG: N-acetyltransferase family protein [Planctomycetota bacterium]